MLNEVLAFVEQLLKYLGEFKAADIIAIIAEFLAKFGVNLL